MLNIKDMHESKELSNEEMTKVTGGSAPALSLFSPTSIPSFSEQIAATNALGGAATNMNTMANAGVNTAGFGSQVVAPVIMTSSQSNDNDLYQGMIQAAIQSSF